MVTSESTMQYSPMRTRGPIDAPGSTRAVGAITAPGSIPGTLGDAAVAVFHAVVLIEGGDGAERDVVETFFAEDLHQVLFEIVQGLEMVRGRGLPNSCGRAEKFLKSAVH